MKNLFVLKKSLAFLLTILMAVVILVANAGSAAAQENTVAPAGNVPSAFAQGPGPTNPAELESFLDELIGSELEQNHIAGAAVSVVKDGELFFAKGYGYADLENNVPVDAEQTIFRIGSIGKTFTWTAVMQLAEQGKLDLDADINTYLDFHIPDTFPQPITLKHLMSHTSGFEDRLADSVVLNAQDIQPAGEWLASHMAARVNPPGDCAAYSNYNAMLAGYIVAQVSGQPYDQYIQEHILDPLGMAHSTAQLQLPSDLRAYASKGYTYVDGALQEFPEFIPQPALLPSGAHHASATDMARFMIAHLESGRYADAAIADAHILNETTMQQMHSTLYTPDPRLLGITYGFFDWSGNGPHTIGHRGYSAPMHSLLLLLPDEDLGVFVIFNSAGADEIANPYFGFHRAFFDHYYPTPAAAVLQPSPNFTDRASRFTGGYKLTAFPYTSFIKISALFGAYTMDISDSGDGTLLIATPYGDYRFVEVEPLYFRQVDGPFTMIVREDGSGHIARIFTDFMNYTAADKLAWYETTGFNMPLLSVCSLLFLIMIPVAAVRLIRNRRRSADRKPAVRGARAADWIILGICILNLVILVGTAWGAMGGLSNELLDPPMIIKIVLGLGILSAVLTVGALIFAVLAWVNSYWGIPARAYYTLVTLAAVGFVWFLNYWNLLGWRY